jgi:hypothetical protein
MQGEPEPADRDERWQAPGRVTVLADHQAVHEHGDVPAA